MSIDKLQRRNGNAEQAALQDGSCGSWVIDSTSAVVCGHMVVINDLGEAYVIPISEILCDIMHRLLAGTSIYIPSSNDIEEWYWKPLWSRNAKPTSSEQHPSPNATDSRYSSMMSTPKRTSS